MPEEQVVQVRETATKDRHDIMASDGRHVFKSVTTCSACGTSVRQWDSFCRHCGRRFE